MHLKNILSSKNGFTLIELLVAASIFSIIIVSLYSAFHTGILSYNKIDSAFNVYQTARIVLNRIELDLKNSFVYTGNDSKFQGTGQALDFFSVVDEFSEARSSPGVCRLKYELNNNSLRRACLKGVSALKEKPEVISDVLSIGVSEISFQYAYLTGNTDKPYDWQNIWPKENEPEGNKQKKTLPLAVKIKLSLFERDKRSNVVGVVEIHKTVSLPVREIYSWSQGGS